MFLTSTNANVYNYLITFLFAAYNAVNCDTSAFIGIISDFVCRITKYNEKHYN